MRGRRSFAAKVIAVVLFSSRVSLAQETEAVVSKDAISVHRVERGAITLRETVMGTVASIDPARAIVVLTPQQAAVVRTGQPCSVQVTAPAVLRCRVTQVRTDTLSGGRTAELTLDDAFAQGVSVKQRLGGLIDVGTADDIVYLERPASARPATTSTIFRLDAAGTHAARVAVVYGRLSGSRIEVISGLAPGDRVIVNDLPGLEGRNYVVLK